MKKYIVTSLALFLTVFVIVSCNNDDKKTTTTTSTGNGKQLQRNIITALQNGNWAALDTLITSDAIDHNPWAPGGVIRGRDSIKKSMMDFRTAFPDMKFEILNELEDGDYVFTQSRFTATNTGAAPGMPPTNKKVNVLTGDLMHMKDGKVIEHWDGTDNIAFMQQLGMMPAPGQMPADNKMHSDTAMHKK